VVCWLWWSEDLHERGRGKIARDLFSDYLLPFEVTSILILVAILGAMVLARLPRLVYATSDPKAGAGGSIMNITTHPQLNHQIEVASGLFADEAPKHPSLIYAKRVE